MLRWTLILCWLLLGAVQTGYSDWTEEDLEGLKWREVGPYRGGRSAAVAGIPQNRETYYFGSTGGGVWKTTDGGSDWKNVSDGFFGGSIGAVAVSSWDPNVIYAGTGEKTVRGNVSHGNGIWKSTDAGRTWRHIGLADTRHIPRIQIHPRDPETVYVAAMGHLFGPNEERGVFRSTDGGENWEKILFVNENAGAVDLIMDPVNPRVLYASTWRILRTPYSLESGGEGSGLWKSTDGGDHWESLSGNEGLPEAPLGISGITVSRANPDRLYAIIEAEEGGVFQSSDAGKTWSRVNQERKLRQRAWYYSRIYADPGDEDVVYVLNVRFWKSKDGGKTYTEISVPHGDNHDLWIDPNDPQRMVQSNDGGANVSFDGGNNWTGQGNQPTAQMYRLSVDNAFPYRLLGGQQDNSAVRIRGRSASGGAISVRDWEPTAGGESGHVVANPEDPEIVYGGSYGGYLIRVDHRTGDIRAVNVWPDNPMGWGAGELKYRFNWNFPLMFSPHDAGTLYAAANVLFRSHDEGQTWQAISGDLTRNLKEKQGSSGGPITQDNTSVEYYGTIFAIAESILEPGVLWTGSDDGLVHVSRDNGGSWADVTPNGLPHEIQINSIEAHPYEAGGLYLAATGYKSDDFEPHLYRTSDYGRSWKKIGDGIQDTHFTRVIRADPEVPGLLFAGTESGLYASYDDGDNWQALQLNLPVSPVTDLAVKDGNLVAATQGRGYWILDDLGLLRQWDDDVLNSSIHLFGPTPVYRLRTGSTDEPRHMGQNPPAGAVIRYWLADSLADDVPITLEITNEKGETIRTFSRKEDEKKEKIETPLPGDDDRVLTAEKGLNELVWNLRWPSAESFPSMILWNRDLAGPTAVPGSYFASLTVGDEIRTVALVVNPDPRLSFAAEDYQSQYDFVWDINRKLTQAHQAIGDIRAVKAQIAATSGRIEGDSDFAALTKAGQTLEESLTRVEEALYQTKMESRQDPLNYPIRLNDKLAGVMALAAMGNGAPTASSIAVRDELVAAIDEELATLDKLLTEELSEFNELAASLNLAAVAIER